MSQAAAAPNGGLAAPWNWFPPGLDAIPRAGGAQAAPVGGGVIIPSAVIATADQQQVAFQFPPPGPVANIIKLIGKPFSRGALFQFRQPGGAGNVRGAEGTFRRFAIEQRRGHSLSSNKLARSTRWMLRQGQGAGPGPAP